MQASQMRGGPGPGTHAVQRMPALLAACRCGRHTLGRHFLPSLPRPQFAAAAPAWGRPCILPRRSWQQGSPRSAGRARRLAPADALPGTTQQGCTKRRKGPLLSTSGCRDMYTWGGAQAAGQASTRAWQGILTLAGCGRAHASPPCGAALHAVAGPRCGLFVAVLRIAAGAGGWEGCALWVSIQSRTKRSHVDASAIRLHPGQQGAVPLPGTAADTHPVPTHLPSRAHLHRFRLTGLWTARFGYIVPVPVSLRSSQSSVMQTAASVLEAAPATSSLAPPCWHAVQPAAPHLLSCGKGGQQAMRIVQGGAMHQASVCGQEHPETTAATG